jgi:23S rRNA pseudouridine1911/1915/1917 synthase
MAVRYDSGRAASTTWRVLERFQHFALIECRLATGRTHQIRVHLAHIGHPVLGDTLYGGGSAVAVKLAGARGQRLRAAMERLAQRQMLHAYELGFVHPRTGQSLVFHTDPPSDFQNLLDALRSTL